MGFRAVLRNYVGTATTPLEDVRPTVWNRPSQLSDKPLDGGRDHAVLLEQYKLYVEMADRVSARRSLTNTFFLTLNTTVFAAIGATWKDGPHTGSWLLVFPLVALLVQCGAWFVLLRSYRQLNSAKYTVIGVLEERLPASPYGRAEWTALGEGKDKAKYWPLTHLEQWVPVTFACTYAGGFIALLASR
ncbi:hypothetical protein [Streptomyces canus]|uniref:RipA family octameric membrane protein n=1 Tax=Streptomyces canus TaxID=58343 RepID=UPI002E2542C7